VHKRDNMPSPITAAKEELAELISQAVEKTHGEKASKEEIIQTIEIAERPFGDLSSSIAFKLAKELKTNPHKIAEELKNTIQETLKKSSRLIKEIAEANGYINANLNEVEYTKSVIEEVFDLGDDYGSSNIGKDAKVLVEYPSVNPTKPWHTGHLRNALLGDSIANMLEFCGYKVEREDYIDDLGLQVAETLWGYRHINTINREGKKFDQFLGEQYVEVNKAMANKDTSNRINKEIEEILKRMEAGNNEDALQAREMAEMCVKDQYITAFSYAIYHDVLMWESDIVKTQLLSKAVLMLKEKGIVETPKEGEYKGCLVLDLEKAKKVEKEFENVRERYKVLIRSNGVATYAMKDFAFHTWKFGIINAPFKFSKFIEKQPNGKPLYTSGSVGLPMEFGKASKVVNIIDASQSHEQATVRALLKLSTPNTSNELVHIAYGRVELEEGSLSGRTGGWLSKDRNYTADDLLKETIKKTKEKTMESKKLNKELSEEVARRIAIAAIKFEYLRVAPEKGIVFSWDKALDLEANSGPYVLYMYARAKHILDKATFEKHALEEKAYESIGRSYGFEVVKKVGIAGEIFENACKAYRPNAIAEYLLDLSTTFSKFYEQEQVIKGGEAKEVRLAIVYAVMQTISNALALLGIESVEAM